MPAPITHIALTDKIYQDVFKDKNKERFFVGTCFPDIRYATDVSREETHFKDPNLEQIKKDGPFWAGLKFHSYLDQKWDQYMTKGKLFEQVPDLDQATRAVKLLQDQLLYDKVDDWSQYLKYLNRVVEDQAIFNLQKSEIIDWQKTLQRYFSNYPSESAISNFVIYLGFSNSEIARIVKLIREMKQNKEIIKIFDKYYQDFEETI